MQRITRFFAREILRRPRLRPPLETNTCKYQRLKVKVGWPPNVTAERLRDAR